MREQPDGEEKHSYYAQSEDSGIGPEAISDDTKVFTKRRKHTLTVRNQWALVKYSSNMVSMSWAGQWPIFDTVMSGTHIRFNFINNVTSSVVVVSLQEVKRLIDIVTGLKNISEYGISGGTLINYES